MRKFVISILLSLFFVNLSAQKDYYNKVIQQNFNWGFRVGFNSRNVNFHEIYQNGEEAGRAEVTNQVGFQGSAFGRINVGPLFVQPEICYDLDREKYKFIIPPQKLELEEWPGETPPDVEVYSDPQGVILNQKSQSVNCTMLFGCNIVKHDSYLFNLFFGPNLRYIFISKYNNELLADDSFNDKIGHPKLNLITGISANAFRLYFDFRYEINVPSKVNFYFSDISNCPDYLKNISIKKNENILSFSLGMMF